MKKASPKKKQKPSSRKVPIEAITSEIVYENSGDSLGTIKVIKNHFYSDEKYREFEKIYQTDPDFFPHNHLPLIDKFKKAKDKKKLRFTTSELKLLEKALDNSYLFSGVSGELAYVKGQLAWANTAFKDKSNSYEKNLREAGRRLGFTKGLKEPTANPLFDIEPTMHLPFEIPHKGKKRRFDPVEVTSYYKKQIDSGIDRRNALVMCVKKYEFASNNACSAFLRENGLENIPQIRKSTARLK